MEQCNSRAALVDYRAVIIAECVRGRLRGRWTRLSVTAKSTALNAADSGRGGVSAHRGEIKAREGVVMGSPGHLPSPPLPSEHVAESERK